MIQVKLNEGRTLEGLDGEVVKFNSGQWVRIKPRWVMPAFLEQFRQALWSAGLTIEDQNGDILDFAQLTADQRWTEWSRVIFYLQRAK
jgi:hypothetical protein